MYLLQYDIRSNLTLDLRFSFTTFQLFLVVRDFILKIYM